MYSTLDGILNDRTAEGTNLEIHRVYVALYSLLASLVSGFLK